MTALTDQEVSRGEWSSASVPARERTDAWGAALAENFCAWKMTRAVAKGFSATIRHRDLGTLRIVDSHCDPCSGERPRGVGPTEDARYFGIQIAREGRKQLEIDGSAITVQRGDIVMWTSDLPVRFTVAERMHKMSVLLPWSEITDRLPERENFRSAVIASQRGIGAVLFAHIESLVDEVDALDDVDVGAVRRATIELAVAALSHRRDSPTKALAQGYLERLQAYVIEHLQDEGLSPASIAEAHRISIRYVHVLFAQMDLSVSSWIPVQRLERCREALASAAHADVRVSDIAYRWGFRDPLHFSRLFRKHFGASPTEYRTSHFARLTGARHRLDAR